MTRHLEAWKLSGRCASHPDPEMWFDDAPAAVAHAKQVCGGCPVQATCLADALTRGEPFGVLGGLTPKERAAVAGRPRRHGTRGCYVQGCDHPDCRRANAVYMAGWRVRRSPVTARATVVVAVLEQPAGRGAHRAWPGQLYLLEATA